MQDVLTEQDFGKHDAATVASGLDALRNSLITVDEFINAVKSDSEDAFSGLAQGADDAEEGVTELTKALAKQHAANLLAARERAFYVREIQSIMGELSRSGTLIDGSQTDAQREQNITTSRDNLKALLGGMEAEAPGITGALIALKGMEPLVAFINGSSDDIRAAWEGTNVALGNAKDEARGLNDKIGNISKAMQDYRALAEMQQRIGNGKPVDFGDVSPFLKDMPQLISLLMGGDEASSKALVASAVQQQYQAIVDAMADTIFNDTYLLNALFKDSGKTSFMLDDVKASAAEAVDAYIEGVNEAIANTQEQEESPFEKWMKEMSDRAQKNAAEYMTRPERLDMWRDSYAKMLQSEGGMERFTNRMKFFVESDNAYYNGLYEAFSKMKGFEDLLHRIASKSITAQDAVAELIKVFNNAKIDRALESFDDA